MKFSLLWQKQRNLTEYSKNYWPWSAHSGLYSVPRSNCTSMKTWSEGRRVKCPGGAVMTYLLLEAPPTFWSSRNLITKHTFNAINTILSNRSLKLGWIAIMSQPWISLNYGDCDCRFGIRDWWFVIKDRGFRYEDWWLGLEIEDWNWGLIIGDLAWDCK